jgi:hypothetical protein
VAIGFTLVALAYGWYYHERSKPGGDRVREAWLERKRCEAAARAQYEKCMKEPKRCALKSE